jgi:hypothetical protein
VKILNFDFVKFGAFGVGPIQHLELDIVIWSIVREKKS